MSWGKRTAPPGQNGRRVEYIRVCDVCALAVKFVQANECGPPINGHSDVCGGCKQETRTVLWQLPERFWVLLEVYLAKKEASNG